MKLQDFRNDAIEFFSENGLILPSNAPVKMWHEEFETWPVSIHGFEIFMKEKIFSRKY